MAEAQIIEKRRYSSPAVTPQALAWDAKKKVLWMGSRDLRRIYAIDPQNWKVLDTKVLQHLLSPQPIQARFRRVHGLLGLSCVAQSVGDT